MYFRLSHSYNNNKNNNKNIATIVFFYKLKYFICIRPQTAGAVPCTNRRLSDVLHQMSPDMASLIKEALGPNLKENQVKDDQTEKLTMKQVKIPGVLTGLEPIHERLQGQFMQSCIILSQTGYLYIKIA